MDFMKYKMQIPNSMPEAIQMEMSRLQIELQRRDALIEEQQKRIFQLEDELKRCNKQIQDLVVQLANYKDSKPKPTDLNYKPPQSRYWTAEEHERFIEAVKRYGPKDVKAIAQYVGTRNPTQVRTHAQKYYLRMERERKRKEDGTEMSSEDYPLSPDEGEDIEEEQSEPKQANEEPKAASSNDASTTVDSVANANSSTNGSEPASNGRTEQPPAKKQRKRSNSTQRRSSLPVDLNLRPEPYTTPTVVHSTRQQLQSAAPIISAIKGWTAQEYNLFIEGLLSFPEERDINKKCKMISERFLPKYSPEDIKQCYAILHNYVKNKEAEDQSDSAKRLKAVEGMSGLSVPSYTTTSMSNMSNMSNEPPPVTLRYNVPRTGYPFHPYPGIPLGMYPGVQEAPYPAFASPYSSPDAALLAAQRRASYPMDAFSYNNSQNGNIPPANGQPSAEAQEHLFNTAPEYPTWSNTTTEPPAPMSNGNTTVTSIAPEPVANHHPSNQEAPPQSNI